MLNDKNATPDLKVVSLTQRDLLLGNSRFTYVASVPCLTRFAAELTVTMYVYELLGESGSSSQTPIDVDMDSDGDEEEQHMHRKHKSKHIIEDGDVSGSRKKRRHLVQPKRM